MHHRIGKNGDLYKGKKGAGIIFTDGKKVLLLKRSASDSHHAGKWGIPGGKVESGETSIDGATRESKEECGNLEGTRFDSLVRKDGSFTWTTYFYKINAPFDCKLSKEHDDYEWVNIEDVDRKNLHPKFKEEWTSCKKRIPQGSSFKEWLANHG